MKHRRDILKLALNLPLVSLPLANSLFASTRPTTSDLKKGLKKGLKFGYLPIADHLLISAQDFFDNKTHTLVPIKFSAWSDLAEAFKANAIDLAFILAPIALELKAQNTPIKALLRAHSDGSSLNVRLDSKIESFKELKGKKIAVPSRFSSQYFLLDRILHKSNLTLKDIQTIDMSPPEMQAALYHKSIDAFIVAEPFGVIGNLRKISKTLAYSKDIYPNHSCCILCAREEILTPSIIASLKDSLHQASMHLLPNKVGQKDAVIKVVLDKHLTSFDNLRLKREHLEEFKDFIIREKLSRKMHNLNLDNFIEDIA
ncbi:ABC transporter substrate-binding protein [Helicobacter sp. 11S02629-2]|uniref:ABC transporter substrate-binding protein n=1 Tax=Helicobacter sp. 11S02629-2 TaxID=1476195 RepID=UPI000BA52D88|nr:ABC transporter substrate-binding protein [Helicobacter sp. 11S02629-2]PAF43690.1 hypothetical protein BKH40_06730 [Helicobacter sp. 11S02629-2]